MGNLFLIDGTSGVWKNDLVYYLNERLVDSILVKKISTRNRRPSDRSLDLKLVSEDDFFSSSPDYVYTYNGYKYGIIKQEIIVALHKFKNVFLIVRNVDIINQITRDFKNYNIVSVFIYTDINRVIKRMGIDNDSSLKTSIEQSLEDYLRNSEIYNMVIINGSTANDFYRLINMLIRKYSNLQSKLKSLVSTRIKLLLNILFPLIDTALIGLSINILTQYNPISYWQTFCIILSLALMLNIVVFQYIVNCFNIQKKKIYKE